VTTHERPGLLGLAPDELVACVGCGLCLPHCPTYRVTGDEIASPRGRIVAMRVVDAGAGPADAAFVEAMDACVQCRGCEAACPSGVRFGHLMEDTRATLSPRRGRVRRAVEAVALRGILPHPHRLAATTRAAAVAQRLGLVPRRLGLPRLPLRAPAPLVADPEPEVILFTGCVMDAWQRDVHRAALRLMRATGTRVGLPGRGAACCGALHVHAGHRHDAERLAERVVASMPPDLPVVVDSAGCGAQLADYGRLLGTEAGRSLAERVVDVSTWLAARAPTFRPSGTVVVVQDPCHLRHVQRAAEPVAALLARAYDVRRTDDDGLCCGAGGAYAALEPALATAIRDRKVAAIRAAAGTDTPFVVASANPGCAMHLAAAGLTVRHPVELLEAARGPD
jgi:glycolate oxidase iron-sulfur subunit